MKLRILTPQETDKFLEDISTTIKLAIKINNKAVDLLDEKYSLYKLNFSASLFKWKALKRNDFLDKLSNTDCRTRIIDSDWAWRNGIDACIPVGTQLMYGETVPQFYNSKILTRYGLPALTEYELKLLSTAARLKDWITNSETNEFYKILTTYAAKPFEFEKSDIDVIEYFQNMYKICNELKDTL